MQIVITIDDIDYGDFVERYYPLVKDRIQGGEGMGAMLLDEQDLGLKIVDVEIRK